MELGTDDAGGAYAPMNCGGHDEKFLVNTGSFVSLITSSAADRLGLRRRKFGGDLTMFGGERISEFVLAYDVSFGGMKPSLFAFYVMSDRNVPAGVTGSIGLDTLRPYDVELDLANAKMRLYSPDHCPGQGVYWTHQPYAQIPIQLDPWTEFKFPIQLDGKTFEATLATGSSRTLLDFESAQKVFGWEIKAAGLQFDDTRKDGMPAYYRFPFKSLTFPGVSVADPDIMLVPASESHLNGDSELRIGMDMLRRLHIYLAFKEKNIYLTSADAH